MLIKNYKYCFLIALSLLMFFSCRSQKQKADLINNITKNVEDSFILGNNLASLKDSIINRKTKQLGLDSLITGLNGLQIRIWFTNLLSKINYVVTISYSDDSESIKITKFETNWFNNRNFTTVKLYDKKELPKSGWDSFINRLNDLRLFTLPNEKDIIPNAGGSDGITYQIEYCTKNRYRYYSYWSPENYQNNYWQAKNVCQIIALIKSELEF